nr:TPA_asm: hypothetical protein [Tricladiphe virus]
MIRVDADLGDESGFLDRLERMLLPEVLDGTCLIPQLMRQSNSSARFPVTITHELKTTDPLTIEFVFTLDNLVSDSSSTFSKKGVNRFLLTFRSMRSFRHNCIAEVLFGTSNTDKPISSILKLGDLTDNLTPDIIKKINDNFLVVELKTLRTISEKRTLEAEVLTDLKYKDALDMRVTTQKILYAPVIIGVDHVRTPIPLTVNELEAIRSILSIGFQFEEYCNAHSIHCFLSDGDPDVGKILEGISGMSILPEYHPDPLIITQSWVNHVKANIEEWEIGKILPDFEKVLEDSAKTKLSEVREKMITKNSDSLLGQRREENFWEETKKFPAKIVPNKTIIRLPMIDVKIDQERDTKSLLERIKFSNVDSLMASIWYKAGSSALNLFENFETNTLEEQINLATKEEKERFGEHSISKGKRRRRNRVKISLTSDEEFFLAQTGVRGKKLKKSSQDLLSRRVEAKACFEQHEDTTDIDASFLWMKDLLEEVDVYPGLSNYESILEKTSIACHLNKRDSIDFILSFYKTRLFKMLDFLELLIEEINISRLQNTNENEFILKRIGFYAAFVLIKPTTPEGPIFYSVCVFRDQTDYICESLFTNFISDGNLMMSKFYSLDLHKISHLLGVAEKSLSILTMWMQFFEAEMNSRPKNISQKIWNHFWASFLILLEDKEITSRNLANIRYAYMEMTTGNVWSIDPLKITKKLDKAIRSRLYLWIIKRIFMTFREMLQRSIIFSKKGKENVTSDKVEGLISWVDGSKLNRFEQALNLSYMSVFHNKDECNNISSYLKMFKKIISEEIKLRNAREDRMGWISPDDNDFRTHEFSLNHAIGGGLAIKRFFDMQMDNSSSYLLKKCCEALDKQTMLKLATTKSSACEMDENPFEMGVKMNKRDKCLGESLLLCRSFESKSEERHNHLMRDIGKYYKHVHSIGKVQANMFKKLQIGGTREIFVLTFQSRIIINFVEIISRTICEMLPGEMLTKGTKKLSTIDEHFKGFRKCKSIHISNSSDAQTWCQQFVMKLFAAVLIPILPEELINPVCNVLNLVTLKELELPKELLELFHKNRNILSYDEEMNELKYQHLGSIPRNDLIDKNSKFLKNRSNMMQGILHYTSSLIHSGQLMLWKDYASAKMEEFQSLQNWKITHLQSSDDSCIIISITQKKELPFSYRFKELIKIKLLLVAREESMKFWSAKSSYEKSTISADNGIFEFNSEFHGINTLLLPSIKYSIVSLTPVIQVKMENRLHHASNMRAQIIKSGGSIFYCSVVERLQMRVHYLLLGLNIRSDLFMIFFGHLLNKPHPSFGFFPLEHEIVSGIGGYRFALYNLYQSNENCRLVLNNLRASELNLIEDENPVITSVALMMNQLVKFEKFKKKHRIIKNEVIEELNEKPYILYRPPLTMEELILKLKQKACSVEMAEALDFSTPAKFFTTSLYILSEKCVTSTLDNLDGRIMKKMSLLSIVLSSPRSVNSKDEEFEKIIFPERVFFNSIKNISEFLENSEQEISDRNRNRFLSIRVCRESPISSVSLYDLCKEKWFKMPCIASKAVKELAWVKYLNVFPWLRDDIAETLEASPFTMHAGLSTFLSSLGERIKTIEITGPAKLQGSNVSSVKDAIINCQWPKRRIILDSKFNPMLSDNLNLDLQILKTLIWRCLNIPNKKLLSTKIASLISTFKLQEIPFENVKDAITGLTESDKTLFILKQFIDKNSIDIDLLDLCKSGTTGSFVIRQKCRKIEGKVEYYGAGKWSGSIIGIPISVNIFNDTLESIEIRKIEQLPRIMTPLCDLVDELNFKAPMHPKNGTLYLNIRTRIRCSKNNYTVPIIELTDLVLPDLRHKKPSILVEYNRIKACLIEDGKSVTVIGLTITSGSNSLESDFVLSPDHEKPRDLREHEWCWIANSPLDPDVCMDFMKTFPDWSRSVFMKCLIKNNFRTIYNQIADAVEEAPPPEEKLFALDLSTISLITEDLDALLEELENDELSDAEENSEEIPNVTYESLVEIDEDDIAILKKKEVVTKEPYYLSNFFDRFIGELKEFSISGMERLAQGFYLQDDALRIVELAKILKCTMLTSGPSTSKKRRISFDD